MPESSVHNDPVERYQDLLDWLISRGTGDWANELPGAIKSGLSFARYGDLPGWLKWVDEAPAIRPSICDFTTAVRIGAAADLDSTQRQKLEEVLFGLMPWRKGPFELFGIHLDAEWRSDLKWDRIVGGISSLEGRDVLDVGCGNGYYMLRMLGQGANRVVGIDPSPRFVVQFELLKKLIVSPIPADVLPVRAEQLPAQTSIFDTAFSMGVLYHRRDPDSHLRELYEVLKPGGEFILETLIIEGNEDDCLVPKERYAQMRNVWSVPSLELLKKWIQNAGYQDISVIDVSKTSTEEQRQTPWMQFQSLSHFLDPTDPTKTVEGYPAPLRAAVRATRP